MIDLKKGDKILGMKKNFLGTVVRTWEMEVLTVTENYVSAESFAGFCHMAIERKTGKVNYCSHGLNSWEKICE